MISIRAKGVLFELVLQNRTLSAEYLSDNFKEGRDAMRAALKELEDAGFIERTKPKVNGKILSMTTVTNEGMLYLLGTDYQALAEDIRRRVFRHQFQPPEQLAYTPYPSLLANQTSGPPTKGGDMPYDFFAPTSSDDDAVQEKIKREAARRAERQQAKQDKRNNPKVVRRQDIPRESWSSVDTGFEFAHRLEQHWHIDPFSLKVSVLVPGIAAIRKRLDTDGEVECKMMDYFFSRLQIDKYKDGEILVKMFLKQADELKQMADASLASITVEEQELTDKSWEWMEE